MLSKIPEVKRYWIKSQLISDGKIAYHLVIMANIPLHPSESGYDESVVARLCEGILESIGQYEFRSIEMINNLAGQGQVSQ